ncbi:unnamed protein product [Linum tenue]|uniref:Uncharacterized protein n=1 Tax=Linum tenue TaxID=586396 RepID=A0AAV0QWJ1_9ROSI|nr:unnamed protein product [Linum tenue]
MPEVGAHFSLLRTLLSIILFSFFCQLPPDLLYKDYARQPPNYFKFQSIKWNFDLSCETQEILPGLTTLFRFTIPDSSKVELRFIDDYVGLTAGAGVKASKQGPFSGNSYDPILSFSGLLGANLFSIGAGLSFDVSNKSLDDFSAGLCFNGTTSPITSLNLDDKLDTLRASFYHSFSDITRTAVAAELKHSFSGDGASTLTVGIQHDLFEMVFLKARVDTNAKLGAFIQLGLWEKLMFAASAELELRASDNNCRLSKVGLALSFLP